MLTNATLRSLHQSADPIARRCPTIPSQRNIVVSYPIRRLMLSLPPHYQKERNAEVIFWIAEEIWRWLLDNWRNLGIIFWLMANESEWESWSYLWCAVRGVEVREIWRALAYSKWLPYLLSLSKCLKIFVPNGISEKVSGSRWSLMGFSDESGASLYILRSLCVIASQHPFRTRPVY